MSTQEKGNDTFKGFLSYFYGNFIVLLLGFIQTPLLTRILSTDEYGRTGMFETAVTVIYIFAILGLDQAYIRYYYEPDTDRGALLRRCLTPALFIVTVLSGLYILFARPANIFLFGESSGDVVALVIIYTFISVFERFFFLDVRMQQNGRLYSNINITEKVLSILTIIAAFYIIGNDFRIGLYSLVVPWGITTSFLIIRYFYLRASRSGTKTGSRVPSYRELISYGTPFITVLLMEWALSSCDRIALRSFASFDELGVYTSAMKIIVLLITFKNTFIAYWSPVAMERFESGINEENICFFRRAYETVVFLCISGAALLILFRKVIVLLLGPSYRNAESVIPFLTLMPIFAMMFEITNQSIKFGKQGKYLNIASLAAIAVNIGGNLLLVPGLGGTGAAITTGISYIVYFGIGSYFAEKCIKVGYNYKKTALYALLISIYCAEASFINNTLWDTVCGLLLLVFICAAERKQIIRIMEYGKGFLSKK
ncbi:MAG: oligosaccharide flippase family protein [Lachnospiraceae bacterium]|nr:oligosaccharide flippase family protein [Lachnospiraceae bacterium]